MIIKTFGKIYSCTPNEIGMNERKFLGALANSIRDTSSYQSNLIVNLTWFFPEEADDLIDWIKSHMLESSTKVYFVASIDGGEWFTNLPVYTLITQLVCDTEIVGFGPDNWSSWFPSWMTSYQDNEIILNTNFKYTFLSYNRKPKQHRENLVRGIIDNNLLHRGWVTYEQGKFAGVDSLSANTDRELDFPDDRFTRPEDLTTLGNIDIWNNVYCVISSETEPEDSWQVTEKTWKPIMGMRPYMINGNPNLSNILKKLGFVTPAELFENSELNTGSVESIVNQLRILCNKSHEELYQAWIVQQEMLLHNRNRFKELAVEWDYSSVPVTE